MADIRDRSVRRVPRASWSLEAVLDEAGKWLDHGPVLATFDVPLGVPKRFGEALRQSEPTTEIQTFLDVLSTAATHPSFYRACAGPEEWDLRRPFFVVPPGAGGLTSYVRAAAAVGADLLRQVEASTGGKSAFVKSGIPGSVGSSAAELWQELSARLIPGRQFKVWPFEGELADLVGSSHVIVGETYPRAAYATALSDSTPPFRAQLTIAKTDWAVRRHAVDALRSASWVRSASATLHDLDRAESSEDDFDACLTAAALLRCLVEGAPLCPPILVDASFEGGMIGTGSVNLVLPSRSFAAPAPSGRQPIPRGVAAGIVHRDWEPSGESPSTAVIACPITGCSKVFKGSRGGWDAHVGSARGHLDWHPDVRDPEERKRLFRAEFPGFFH